MLLSVLPLASVALPPGSTSPARHRTAPDVITSAVTWLPEWSQQDVVLQFNAHALPDPLASTSSKNDSAVDESVLVSTPRCVDTSATNSQGL